ncbi:MAG: helix-turn-helix domain-containing protein, partial [Chloroflexota bacterium]|nr:helix-turn-helix domain-containing protein [Chloroflexota bacterium]
MSLSDRQLLDALGRTPFVDSTELAGILGEPHSTVHRVLAELLAEGIAGRVSHGTVHLPSSQRYHLTAQGIREATGVLGFDTPSDFVRAYPKSREWLTLLIRRMDAVAAVYRLAASMSPGIEGLQSHVEFHRRGRFDATITLHDGRSFGVVRQGLALRRRSLYDRLRAIAEYDYSRRPGTVLILVPSVWEERLTTRFCDDRNIDDC